MNNNATRQNIKIEARGKKLRGIFRVPKKPFGLVVFSHGSGSGRLSPRNNFVAESLGQSGLATFLVDLLSREEDQNYQNRFDIGLLAGRLVLAVEWAARQPAVLGLPAGLFGASTGAASALRCAASLPENVRAVVSRGGRPDLAMDYLGRVLAPTLLIVGGNDREVLSLNRQAYKKLKCVKKLGIIEGATHLFEEPGALEQMSRLAADWFVKYLRL